MKIFISYSRDDATYFAKHVQKYLIGFDNDVFIDVNSIQVGDPWADSIEQNISKCDIFVVILTFGTLKSPYVEREVIYAQKQNKIIIPCINEDVELSEIKWGIEKIQGIEFSDKEELARKLYSKIKKLKNVKTVKNIVESSNQSYDTSKPPHNQITILFLSASPTTTTPLELIQELNIIDQKLRYTAEKGTFKLEQRHDISIKWLIEQLLNYNPQILHFSGRKSEKSALVFENYNTGEIEEVPPSALSNLFKVLGKKIDLVFLNACFSEKQARAIAKHVNCVIGVSNAISDMEAIVFASTFYSSLGFGKSVKDAFDLAVVQLGLLSIPENAIPKLIVKEDIDPSKIMIIG